MTGEPSHNAASQVAWPLVKVENAPPGVAAMDHKSQDPERRPHRSSHSVVLSSPNC